MHQIKLRHGIVGLVFLGIFLLILTRAFLQTPPGEEDRVSVAKTTLATPAGIGQYVLIEKTGDDSRQIADLILLAGPEAHLAFLSKPKHEEFFEPTVNFSKVKEAFQQEGKSVVLTLAAAFTPDWKTVQGFALEDGESVGAPTVHGFGAFLVIQNGKPTFVSEESMTDSFFSEVQNNRASLFEQIPAITQREISMKYSPSVYEYRFYVEVLQDGVLIPGVVVFHQEMTLHTALQILLDIQKPFTVQHALYLDAGAVSAGSLFDALGTAYPFIDEGVAKYTNRYTNLLVVYSQK